MQWQKHGLVYQAEQYANLHWRANSALTPQPFRLDEKTIRVFCGFRDQQGVSRIGFVDVDGREPQKVIRVSDSPVLDVGRDGCFDDNGLIMGDVVRAGDEVYLFYVGFQLIKKAKFMAFSGVAVSHDNAATFTKLSESPIIDRAPEQAFIGAIHTARYENGIWRLWFAQGDGWQLIDGVPYPQYHIRYVEAENLLDIPRLSKECVRCNFPDYRIGRPKVYRRADGQYIMLATKGAVDGKYFPEVFVSSDGIEWRWCEEGLGIDLSQTGWDSETLCYPALISGDDRTWMFYNGNRMGYSGFGLASTTDLALDQANAL
jgi:hypothetical protein